MSAQLKSPEAIEDRIDEIHDEIKQLEYRQAMYRRVIGPKAAELIKEWRGTLDSVELQFAGLVRSRVESGRKPSIDLSLPGAAIYFNRAEIEARLPELAFFALGPDAMHQHERFGEGYVPTGPALKALRAELEQLTSQ